MDDAVTATAPKDTAARVRAVIGTLSPAEARVAEIIERDLERVAHLTVVELAAEARTSTATVVRTVRRLGFAGYSAFRLAAAADTARFAAEAPLVSLAAEIGDDDSASDILTKLAAFEIDQLRATAELLDPERLNAAVESISGARRVVAFGIGASGLVAQDLALKLTRIGMACSALTERDSAVVSACLLSPQDVAVAVSHSGENAGATDPLAAAARTGATTVAITGAPRSTVARLAGHVLLTAGREFGLRSAAMASRSSQMFVVDALYVGVANRMPHAREALQLTYDAVRSRTPTTTD